MNTATQELDRLGAEAASLDAQLNPSTALPGMTEAAPGEPEQKEEISSVGLATLAVAASTGLAEQAWPVLQGEFRPELKGELVSKLVPVLDKHGIKSEFFEKWKEEFEFGMLLGGVVVGCYVKIQQAKAAEPANVTKETAAAAPAQTAAPIATEKEPDGVLNAVTSGGKTAAQPAKKPAAKNAK